MRGAFLSFIGLFAYFLVTSTCNLLVLPQVEALVIQVKAGTEECFIEYVKSKRTAFLSLAVVEAGSDDEAIMDIRLKSFGPFPAEPDLSTHEKEFFNTLIVTKFNEIENSKEVLHNNFNFDTEHRGGWYKYCLDNTHSTWTDKTVDFLTTYGLTTEGDLGHEDTTEISVKEAHSREMNECLMRVRDLLSQIQREQKYYIRRTRRHEQTIKSNGTRIFYFTFFQFLLLIGLYGGQMFLLKKWFNNNGMRGTWA